MSASKQKELLLSDSRDNFNRVAKWQHLSMTDLELLDKYKNNLIYYKLPLNMYGCRGDTMPKYWQDFQVFQPDCSYSNIKFYAYFENNEKLYKMSREYIYQFGSDTAQYEACIFDNNTKLVHLPFFVTNDDEKELDLLETNHGNLINIASILYKDEQLLWMLGAIDEVFYKFTQKNMLYSKHKSNNELYRNSDLLVALLFYDACIDGWVRLDNVRDNKFSQEIMISNLNKVKYIPINDLDKKYNYTINV